MTTLSPAHPVLRVFDAKPTMVIYPFGKRLCLNQPL